MRRLILLTLYLLLGARLPLVGQGELIVMSYNVENLFDLEDHPERADDEFLPSGSHRWTKARYERKLHQIAEVLSSAGSLTHFPDLVALVEVENAGVLRDLLSHTPLGAHAGYAFTVTEGEDPRGINVALLYRTETFRLLGRRELPLHFPFDSTKRTRPILEISGLVPTGDTLHLYVCHLPSRRGGARQSERYRRYACEQLRELATRRLEGSSGRTHVLVLGDFNGAPEEPATREALGSRPYPEGGVDSIARDSCRWDQLYELSPRRGAGEPPGSYCFRGVWTQLDQIHASRSLLGGGRLSYVEGSAEIFYRPFMGQPSVSSPFPVPFRTYGGAFWRGGYSDHYPLRIRLRYERP
nr:endonuclease/exonuclease/phosphatase family protein [uncultured Porphyromonas sp.]